MMYGWQDGAWGWGAWVVMIVLMVLFWTALAAVAVTFFRHWRGGYAGAPPPVPPGAERLDQTEPAMRVLEERFARGEIDAEEFTKRRDLLRSR